MLPKIKRMNAIIKIILSIVAIFICGGLARGCNIAAQTNPAARIFGIFPFIILVGGLIGIWRYKPKNKDSNDPGNLE